MGHFLGRFSSRSERPGHMKVVVIRACSGKKTLARHLSSLSLGFPICNGVRNTVTANNEALHGPGSKLNTSNTTRLGLTHTHSVHLTLIAAQWRKHYYDLYGTERRTEVQKDK